MPKCEILIGGICSGKTTYRNKKYLSLDDESWVYVSRDAIRLSINGLRDLFNPCNERLVTKIFWKEFNSYTRQELNIIVDNTNVNPKYIKEIINKLPEGYTWELKWFYVPLWKAYYRNVIRYFKDGIYIPIRVIRKFHKQYKKLEEDYNSGEFFIYLTSIT